MSVVITTYTLASGLMQQGMTWWQAMLTILLGNVHRARADDPQRACRHEVRRVVPGAVPRQLRREGRQRAGDPARARRVRLVRHPDVDRRPGAEHAAGRGVAGLGGVPAPASGSRSRSSGSCRSGSSSTASKASRSSRAGRRRCCSAAARCCSCWAIAAAAASAHILSESSRLQHGQRAVLAAVSRRADRERRLLGDAQPEHPGLHALRAKPALAGARPGARPARDDDGVRVHRRRGHERDDRRLRRSRSGIRWR